MSKKKEKNLGEVDYFLLFVLAYFMALPVAAYLIMSF
jgi:hypothetical protein